ncbi:hypothetical protein BOTBODRAFT_170762 [Botryobasidium botryosum FD-172 SS1]|uniref:Uncharacterized protein n=1 Tax=Botryobasidium botryosum (strain FD-172 SS1) TaxID=930990 RepID=A0A067N7E9_BOTB1|nr:hypothetical protein BOTBODRAFT_170762 [Botryobasidium botryosum FD-172 SS1]
MPQAPPWLPLRLDNESNPDGQQPPHRWRCANADSNSDTDDNDTGNGGGNSHGNGNDNDNNTLPQSTDATPTLSKEEMERRWIAENFTSVKWLNTDGTPKTDEEIRDIQMSTWKSPIYGHFKHKPKIIIHTKTGKRVYVFKCQKPGKLHGRTIKHVRNQTITMNLRKHKQRCAGTTTKPLLKYSRELLQLKLAQWCTKCRWLFALVDDEGFEEIMQMLQTDVELPSSKTISCNIKEFKLETDKNDVKGKMHVSIDGWATPNTISFLGITLHFFHEGRMWWLILDFIA